MYKIENNGHPQQTATTHLDGNSSKSKIKGLRMGLSHRQLLNVEKIHKLKTIQCQNPS
jgi:hypothetical protein